jgi:hypothetical protein
MRAAKDSCCESLRSWTRCGRQYPYKRVRRLPIPITLKGDGLPGTSVHSLIALYRLLVDLNCFRSAFRALLKCKRLENGTNFFLEHDVSHGSVVGHETVLV